MEAELQINRSFRNLLHTLKDGAHGTLNRDFLQEIDASLSLLEGSRWDTELTSIFLRSSYVDWYPGEQDTIHDILFEIYRNSKEVNPTDLEKMYALIELFQRRGYRSEHNEKFKDWAESLQCALSTLKRNNFEVPGMKIL